MKKLASVKELETIAKPIERSSLRTRLLKRLATTDGLQRRMTLMLYWQELRQAIPFGLAMLCIGLASVAYEHATTYALPAASLLPTAPLWIFFFTLECGLRTFRHEQQKQHGLFWAHRGISPTKVWIIKNTVWLPLLLAVSFIALWLDQWGLLLRGASTPQGRVGLHGIFTVLADPLATPYESKSVELVNGSRTTIHHALIAMLTTGYFVAQLCSAWLRPPFVAGFVALMFFFAGPAWIDYSQRMDVPLTFSAWPIVTICAIATVWSGRSWMDGRQDGRIWIKRIAVISLLPLGLWLGHQYYRTTQIPNHYLTLTQGNLAYPWAITDVAMVKNLPTMIENPATDALWLELLLERNEVSSRPCTAVIDEIFAVQNWDQSFLPNQIRTSWQASISQTVHLQITAEASSLVWDAKAGEALQLLVKGVRITEYLASQTNDWKELEKCMNFLRSLHQHIHWCSSSDEVKAKDLQPALAQFDAIENYADLVASMLRNREETFLQLMQPDSDLGQQFIEQPSVTFPCRKSWPRDFMKLSYADQARHHSLLKTTTSGISWEAMYGQKFPLKLPPRWQHQFRRWAATTPEFDLESDPMLVPPNSALAAAGPMVSINAAVNIRKATWWILQSQLYRREFELLPTEAELQGWLKINGHEKQIRSFIDWMTNESFDFRLEGSGITTHSELGTQKLELHAQQPLIGYAANLSTLSEEESARHNIIDIPLNRDRIIYLERAAWIYPQPPIGGELAELIRNSPSEQSGRKGTENTGQTEADE